MREAIQTYRMKSIYLMDIEFTIDRVGALAVCDCLEDLDEDIRWCCQTRADSLDAKVGHRLKISYGAKNETNPMAFDFKTDNMTVAKILQENDLYGKANYG